MLQCDLSISQAISEAANKFGTEKRHAERWHFTLAEIHGLFECLEVFLLSAVCFSRLL
jgi:hypothetical protein